VYSKRKGFGDRETKTWGQTFIVNAPYCKVQPENGAGGDAERKGKEEKAISQAQRKDNLQASWILLENET